MPRMYITTPIYYANGPAHLGHAYTTIAGDVIARWYRLKLGDKNVLFTTGMDEHGSKVQKAAKEKGVSPQKFVDGMAERFKNTWKLLHISYDDFIRTTEKRHKETVKKVFKKLVDSGDIYKGIYEGWYCVPCESFWTDLQLAEEKCPECGRKVDKVKEESYFFRLSKYQDKLLKLYEDRPDFLSPKHRSKEIVNRVKEGLKDLSISRKKVDWGIEFPLDPKLTLYVWKEALINYLSLVGFPDGKKFKEFWPAIHIMAKEIYWFHGVIWPAMLMSAGIPVPRKVFAHGWLTVEGRKMSKSFGNFLVPEDIVKKYGVDQFRYFLMKSLPFGEDGDFSEEALRARINGELVADLGNLVSRVTKLAERHEGKLCGKDALGDRLELKQIEKDMEAFELHHALEKIWSFVRICNKYINNNEPWKQSGKELGETMYNLLEALRVLSVLLEPFLPETAGRLRKQLRIGPGTIRDCAFRKEATRPGKGEHLFRRVE
ncbi:MAG: methionine--tRNA ligase [Candidatus Aenigmarchaeota archaeon]|nr:methionine--tRNA ligase [Candidatus Aenigmarchaeota archaeon]